MANNAKNNSLSSMNYGPDILLSGLYSLSHLTGIFIKTDIHRNNVYRAALVLHRDCLQLFLLNFPDYQFLCKKKLVTTLWAVLIYLEIHYRGQVKNLNPLLKKVFI